MRRFPVKNEFLDIAAEVGTDYLLFGTLLLNDKNGNKIKNIEFNEHGNVLRINVEILQQWLQGKGRKPLTWQTLVKCLQETKLIALAQKVESSLLQQRSYHSQSEEF